MWLQMAYNVLYSENLTKIREKKLNNNNKRFFFHFWKKMEKKIEIVTKIENHNIQDYPLTNRIQMWIYLIEI